VPTGVALRDAREQLFDAAERVLLRAGPNALTSRAVTTEAGCAKGVLHRHFTDFDAFLAELVLDRARRVEAQAAVLRESAGTGTVAGNLTGALTALFGSVAVAILSKLGFEVAASTGRSAEADYLKRLGASAIIDRKELAAAPRPLNKERWAGGIDVVGSTTLANVLSMIRYRGAVAACGLAGGMDLPVTVAPFILRGVSLLGIDSVMRPLADRQVAWKRLEADLDRTKLSEMTKEIGLAEVLEQAPEIVDGRVRGRIVVKIG